jgi:hypothetical protein
MSSSMRRSSDELNGSTAGVLLGIWAIPAAALMNTRHDKKRRMSGTPFIFTLSR